MRTQPRFVGLYRRDLKQARKNKLPSALNDEFSSEKFFNISDTAL